MATMQARYAGLFLGVVVACAGPTPQPDSPAPAAPTPSPSVASATSPEKAAAPPSIVQLRTGRIDPVVVEPAVQATVQARATRDGWEWVVAELPAGWRTALPKSPESDGLWDSSTRPEIVHVSVPGAEAALSFALLDDSDPTAKQMRSSAGPPPPQDVLWLKRPSSDAGQPLRATLFTSIRSDVPGAVVAVELPAYTKLPEASDLDARYTRALTRYIQQLPASPFRSFALASLQRAEKPLLLPVTLEPEYHVGWEDLMGLDAGKRSVELALQTKSPLRAHTAETPTIPISKLRPPELTIPPYAAMLTELGVAVPDEPLARVAPAEFYFARSRDLSALFEVLDEIDSWLTPSARVLDARLERRELAERYQNQLGLRRTALSRRLGPELIAELALVGSDPFLRDGSDVTVLFRPKSETALGVALETTLQLTAEPHGGVESKALKAAGHPVVFSQSKNRAVSRYATNIDGLHVVSNSLGAITRVIEAAQGKRPALAAEPDFRYMLARDANVPADVFAFAGDRFMQSALSPASRILDARRQVAKSELLRVSYAALLFGWLHGKVATSGEALMKSVLFRESELRHFDKQPISFAHGPSQWGPRSAWGTPAALTPLMDLPAPTRVTATEQRAYETFVQRYQGIWAEALDPIALRVRVQREGNKTQLGARLRVLPIARDTQLMDMARIVGDGRLQPGAIAPGFRLLLALAKDSELRRELSGQSRSILGKKLAVDWIGPYAMLGVLDDPSLANALARSEWVPQKPSGEGDRSSDFEWLFEVPLYAALSLESSKGASLALAVLKDRLGDIGKWQSAEPYKGQTITEVAIEGEHLSLFYALTERLLIVTFSERTLHAMIDRARDGKALPAGSTPREPNAAQWVLDLAGTEKGGLWTAITWALAHQLDQADDDTALIAQQLFYGVPNTARDPAKYDAVALGYLGAIPVTQDGTRFELSNYGVIDPARGNEHALTWPQLPVPGSDLDKVVQGLASVRSAVRFDPEPSGGATTPQRSLHVTLETARTRD